MDTTRGVQSLSSPDRLRRRGHVPSPRAGRRRSTSFPHVLLLPRVARTSTARDVFPGPDPPLWCRGSAGETRSCDMPGIPNQAVVVTENPEVVTETLGHSWPPNCRDPGERAPRTHAGRPGRRRGAPEDAARTLWADVLDNEPTVPRKPDEKGPGPLLASLRDRCRLRYSGVDADHGREPSPAWQRAAALRQRGRVRPPRPTGRPDGVSPERPAVPEDGPSAAPGAGRGHRRPDGAAPARGGRLPGRSRQARPAPRGRRTPADPVAQCRRMPRMRSSAS
jgi:hypothetical protein